MAPRKRGIPASWLLPARRDAVAARVSSARQQAALAINANHLCVPHCLVPFGPHDDCMPAPREVGDRVSADTWLDVELRGAIGIHEIAPARRLNGLLRVESKIDQAQQHL